MKKRGMSWTIKGAQRMSRLINLREMGMLHFWITHKDKVDTQPPRGGIRKKIPGPGKDDGEWLRVGLSALHGPHQNRPWAQILRALTREVGGLT
jgi:hypothetical protein